MKLNILKAALEHYILTADCSNEDRKEALAAFASCAKTQECYCNSDTLGNYCHVVSTDAMVDLLNLATYDIYGKAQKMYDCSAKNPPIKIDMRLPFEFYASECRKHVSGITNEQLEAGYYFISDLWHDNEADGMNNPDGSFNSNEY